MPKLTKISETDTYTVFLQGKATDAEGKRTFLSVTAAQPTIDAAISDKLAHGLNGHTGFDVFEYVWMDGGGFYGKTGHFLRERVSGRKINIYRVEMKG
jgi:hypothetical protein